jgi:hypothetical protein
MTDQDMLKEELRWAIANNEDRPRTGAVLAEALEFVDSVEREKGEGKT